VEKKRKNRRGFFSKFPSSLRSLSLLRAIGSPLGLAANGRAGGRLLFLFNGLTKSSYLPQSKYSALYGEARGCSWKGRKTSLMRAPAGAKLDEGLLACLLLGAKQDRFPFLPSASRAPPKTKRAAAREGLSSSARRKKVRPNETRTKRGQPASLGANRAAGEGRVRFSVR